MIVLSAHPSTHSSCIVDNLALNSLALNAVLVHELLLKSGFVWKLRAFVCDSDIFDLLCGSVKLL